MTGHPPDLVFDTGPLSHMARAGWLGALRSVAGDRRVVVPDVVYDELRNGVDAYPHLASVVGAPWIHVVPLESPEELEAFARFSSFLVAKGRNQGEAAVLAYASVHCATAVIDDGAGRAQAQRAGVAVMGTLGLLTEAIREGLLTVPLVAGIADQLLETEYRLPLGQGGYAQWAEEQGLLE